MKTLLTFSWVAFVLLGTSTMAFAWWDQPGQSTRSQLDVGDGVRLVLKNQTSEAKGVLVPAGSFYACVEGYTTEFVFTYILNLEENLEAFDLLIDVTGLSIGGLEYNPIPAVHGPLSVLIETSKGTFESEDYDTDITKTNTHMRLNEVLQGDGTVTITIAFSLLAQGAPNDDEHAGYTANELASAFTALAGQEITFNIAFEVPAYGEQSNPDSFNVHPESVPKSDDDIFLDAPKHNESRFSPTGSVRNRPTRLRFGF